MIELWFNSIDSPELSKVSYRCNLTGSTLVSYRGRGSWRGDGSFPWTAGVRALSALLLSISIHGDKGALIGDKGRLAASLDFALGKPPAWILEMFGVLANKIPVTSKLFIRVNPEGKKTGPFEVRANPLTLKKQDIVVYLNGMPVGSHQSEILLARLSGEELQDASSLLVRPEFLHAVDSHMARSYTSVDIFTEQGRNALLSRIYNHPGFKKYAPAGARITHAVDDMLTGRSRLGIVDSEVRSILQSRTSPIRLTSNMPTIPITVLFRYMSRLYDIPMDIDMSHLHAAEVGKRIVAKDFTTPPDLCVLGLGPSCAILSQKLTSGYLPITPLPASYDELLSGLPPEQMTQNSSFSFIDDFPSTPRLFFERLTASQSISSGSNPVEHFEPADSIALTLQEKNARTILFFPYNIVARLHYGLHQDTSLELGGNVTEMILFGSKPFLSDQQYLKAFLIAMRDCWLRLRNNYELQRTLREELLTSEEYKRIFTRSVEIPFKLAA